MKTYNLTRLGTSYKIVDHSGTSVKELRIVKAEDILAASLGEYSDVAYVDFNDYLEQSNEMVTGFVQDPLSIYWHTCTETEYQLTEVIEICMTDDYEVAVIEIVPENTLDFYSE